MSDDIEQIEHLIAVAFAGHLRSITAEMKRDGVSPAAIRSFLDQALADFKQAKPELVASVIAFMSASDAPTTLIQ